MDGSKLAFWQPQGDSQPAATLVVTLSRASDGSLRASEPRALPSAVKEDPAGRGHGRRRATCRGTTRRYGQGSSRRNPARCRPWKAGFRVQASDAGPLPAALSPDGRWLAFQEPLDDGKARMLIAKVDAAGRPGPSAADWIEIARGDSQAWSPMGGILYYDSDRDGSWCIWAQDSTATPCGRSARHRRPPRTQLAPVDWQSRSDCPRICGVARSGGVQHVRDEQQHLDDAAPARRAARQSIRTAPG